MKTVFKYFLLASCLVTSAEAQRVVTPNRPPNANTYYNPNINASAYALSRNITDKTELRYLHNWFNGLDSLQLSSKVLYGASFRSQHKAQNGTNIYPFVGPTTFVYGGLSQYTNGFFFPGLTNSTYYLAIPNNFWNTSKAAYSFMIAYRPAISTNSKIGNLDILSSWNGALGGQKGPGVGIGTHSSGTSSNINWRGTAVQYWSGDRITNGAGFFPYYGQADQGKIAGIVSSNIVRTDSPQLLFTSFSSTNVAMQVGVGPWVSSTVTGYGPVTNPASYINVGMTAISTNIQDQSYCFEGDIAAVYIFDKSLSESEANELRKLYTRTIGCKYEPRINLLIDGDYLTYGNSYGNVHVLPQWQHLATNSLWGKYVVAGNYATTNATSADIASRTTNGIAKFDVDVEYAIRQYYLNVAGINDLINGVTAADLLVTNKIAYAQARSIGNIVVAHTLPLTTNIHSTFAVSSAWTNYNALLRTSTTSYDYLIDLAADSRFLNYNDTTYYTNSGAVLTSRGHAAWADLIRTRILYP